MQSGHLHAKIDVEQLCIFNIVFPAVEGDVRLVARRELNGYVIGALQVYIDGAFGTVCGAGVGNALANVACRQLGFIGGGLSPFADEALTEAELMVCQHLQA